MYDDLPAAGAAGGGLLAMTGLADVPMLLAVAMSLVLAGAVMAIRKHGAED